MKKYNKLINWGLILNLVGLGFILLLILNSWLGYGYLVDLEILFLFLVLSALIINGYFYLGQLKNLNLVSIFSLIVSSLMFFIGFYPYQETPLILVIVGSSLLIYSDYKKQNPFSNNQSNFQISNNDYLKRAELFLEDNDFTKTIEYCEKALDQNPQLGLAYLFKLLALNEVVSVEQYVSLAKSIEKLTSDPLYKRFKQFTPQYLIEIKEKPILIEFEKRDTISETSNLLKKQDRVENLDLLEKSLIALNRIHPYQNSASLILQLEGKISITKQLIRESKYVEAIKLSKNKNYVQLKIALQVFSSLENYKESEKYIKKIETKLKEIEHLRRVKALKFTGKFAVIAILLSIVFNLTNTFFFKYYTINLVTNGGPNVQPISLRFNEEVDLPDIQKTGYTFDNWFLDESLTVLSDVNKMPAENITLYAGWSVNQYIMTFVTNGGEAIQPITQAYNSLLSIPSTSKTGYTLSGWYRDSAFNQLYNIPSNMPAESLTLYAKWTVNQYSITFVTNGGNSVPNQNIAYGSAISLPTVSRTGYSFGGWFTDPSLNTEFSISTMPAQNLVIYAKWLVNQYTISFVTNGGSSIQSITQDFGSTLTVPSTSKTGYTFSGWYRNNALTQSYNIPSTIPAENLTLYAKWTVKQYTITFITNNGNSIPIQTNSFGSEISLPDGLRMGYSFVGWYTDSALENQFTLSTMPAENITLYAKWLVNQYTLTFISNGGDSIQPITQDFGTSLTIPQINRNGYRFGGWYKNSELTDLYAVSSTMPAETLTIYARWNIEQESSNKTDGDLFGKSIASYGDYFVVGAPGKYAKNRNSFGTVYLYKYSDRSYERLIVPSFTTSTFIFSDYNSLRFGTSVAIEGDYIIIGAPGYDQPYEGQGAIFVYKISDVSYERIIKGDRTDDNFGASVAISNGIIAVGAPNSFGNNTWVGFQNVDVTSGRVYLFKVNNETYKESFAPLDVRNGDKFGASISFNNSNLLIGAPGSSFGGSNGAAYLYSVSNNVVSLQRKIVSSDSSPMDYFGYDLEVMGDYFVIGAPGDDQFGESSGSIYLYKISETNFSRKIVNDNSSSGDLVGGNLSLNNNLILAGEYIYPINDEENYFKIRGSESLDFSSNLNSIIVDNFILVSDYELGPGILYGFEF
jgi:uncharacterized repeat protein (TIGR02543 family)